MEDDNDDLEEGVAVEGQELVNATGAPSYHYPSKR